MLSLKEQFEIKKGVWSKYTHLDFFARCGECSKEANQVDLNKVDLSAKGQAIIAEVENMCCFPIIEEKEFLEIWEYNNWDMEKFLQEHMDRKDRKFYNPFQVVTCRCK